MLFSSILASRSWTQVVCASGLALAAAGCGPNYVVIKQAAPNPLYQQKDFSVAPVDFGKIKEVEPDHVTSINEGFTSELKEEAGSMNFKEDAPFQIVPVVGMLEKGISGGLMSSDSEIHMTVYIKEGETILDEIELRASVNQNDGVSIGGIPTSGYSDTQRLEDCAEEIAEDFAKYLGKRTSKK